MPSLGPRRLALLAIVAAAGARGITREKILGILWSERDEEQARHTLSQTLYSLRRETGRACIAGTVMLRLDESMSSDVVHFQDALQRDDLVAAASSYSGPFLEGFYLAGAPQFEQWVEETRARLQFAALKSLETLARGADEAGAAADAAEWWRRLTGLDPLNAKYAAGRIRALAAASDQIGALRVAREYEARVRRELDTEPDVLITQLAGQLRSTETAPTPAALTQTTARADVAPDSAFSHPEQDAGEAAVAPHATRAQARGAGAVAPARQRWLAVAALLILAGSVAAAWTINGSLTRSPAPLPFLAVGVIESGDTTARAAVLRDMLATNLARVQGLQVVSNSRLLELLARSQDHGPVATNDAARRAGADEVIEGAVSAQAGTLTLTLRRVALRGGMVVQGYSVHAADLNALTDSATAAIASDFQLDAPPDAVVTVRTRSAVAYALYEQGLRAFYQGDFPATVRVMGAALERDSTFAMAAAYAWLANRGMSRHTDAERLLPVLTRLASRTAERERLWIEGIVAQAGAPLTEFLAVTRALTQRFPDDPDGQILYGQALFLGGEWAAGIEALNRAVAIDSAAGATQTPHCRVCAALYHASDAYAWWDSLPAAERTIKRLVALRGGDYAEWSSGVEVLLRLGRRAEAEAASVRVNQLSTVPRDFSSMLDRDLIRSGRLDELEARLVAQLRTGARGAYGEVAWLLGFVWRNQGRLREAYELTVNGQLPGSAIPLQGVTDPITPAIVSLERGDTREAARRFSELADRERGNSQQRTGTRARGIAWYTTLAATAFAAAGDTAAVRALADTVQRVGAQSSFARDYRLHHFLHGLLLQQQNRHAEAVAAFRRSFFSLTDGYTRINLELARSLVQLGRHAEAIAVLQPALRGGVDGGNTYVTHIELREALAHAFYAAGQRDSAAAQYAAVERAWRRADPQFRTRYAVARERAARGQ